MTDYPDHIILIGGDLNREDQLAEVYLEPLIERIPLNPNHVTHVHDTENWSTLSALFCNRPTKTQYTVDSIKLSDHYLINIELPNIAKPQVDLPKIPNRKTARSIQISLLDTCSWRSLHNSYPSKRSRLSACRISHNYGKLKEDKLAKLLKMLQTEKLDQIQKTLNEEWDRNK